VTSKPWMPLYIGDFIADTMHLSATETGIYIRLLMHCWQQGSIPRDDRKLALISHCDVRLWHQYRETVLRFFDVVDASTMTNKRVSTERLRAEKISNERKGAALQKHSRCKAIAVQMHTQSQSQSQIDAPATPKPSIGSPLVSDAAFKLANEIARLCGHSEGFLPPSWLGAPMHVQSWLNQGWTAEQITTSCLRQLANRDGVSPEKISYFDKGIAEFVARPPTASAKTEVPHGRKLSPNQQRSAEFRAFLAERRRDRERNRGAGRSDGELHAVS
jgi:uncharacterized protein YdaU (DUF1376 family)